MRIILWSLFRQSVVLSFVILSFVIRPEGAVAGTAIFDPSTITVKTLDNGLRVVVQEAHDFPLVAIDLYVRAGSVDDPPTANGTSHLLEHVVFQSPASRVAERIDELGGQIDGRTTRDFTHFAVVVGSAFFPEALSALAEAVGHPNLDQMVVSREISVMVQELLMAENNPVERLSEAAFAAYFRHHPYRLAAGGNREQLSRIPLGLLTQFFEQHYTAPNMALVVVGDVDPQVVYDAAAASFAGLSSSPPPPINRPLETPPAGPLKVGLHAPEAGHFVMLAFPAPGIAKRGDVCAMDVVLAILGMGHRSRLQDRLVSADPPTGGKDGQVAVQAGAGFLTQRDPGLMELWAETPEGGGPGAVAAILDEVRSLRGRPVPDEELERAKAITLGSYTMQSESYLDRAGSLGFYEAIDTYQFAVDYEQAVRAVTAEDVRRVAQKYLDPSGYVLVTLEPAP